MGERIGGAQVVEVPGNDHLPWEGDRARLVDELKRFLAQLDRNEEPDRVLVTALFTDVVPRAEQACPDTTQVKLLDRYGAAVESELRRFRGRAVASADARPLAVFDGPARAIRCAHALGAQAQALGLEVGLGLHTGEVRFDADRVSGIAVDVGAQVAAKARAGEVLVSHTVRDHGPRSRCGLRYRVR